MSGIFRRDAGQCALAADRALVIAHGRVRRLPLVVLYPGDSDRHAAEAYPLDCRLSGGRIVWLRDPERGGGKSKRGADRHYKVMPVRKIKALPVGDLADPAR